MSSCFQDSGRLISVVGVWENEGGVGRVWLCSGIGAVVGLFYGEIHLMIRVAKHAQNRSRGGFSLSSVCTALFGCWR